MRCCGLTAFVCISTFACTHAFVCEDNAIGGAARLDGLLTADIRSVSCLAPCLTRDQEQGDARAKSGAACGLSRRGGNRGTNPREFCRKRRV